MKKKFSGRIQWVSVILFLIGVNVISWFVFTRIDLTNDRRFTISEPVKKLLKNIPEPVEFYLFLRGEMPSGFKMLSQSAAEQLNEFKETSRGRVQYKYVSPEEKVPGTNVAWADTLQSMGILPINLKVQLKAGEQSQFIYPAAVANSGGKMYAINLYPASKRAIDPSDLNNAESLFEYEFARAIQKINSTIKPMVAYATGNGEPSGVSTYDLVENILKPDYSVFTVNLKEEEGIPDTFKLLIMVKPTESFSENEKLKIDQFVMRGGRVLAFIDRLEAEMDSLQIKNQVVAYDRNLNLEDLFFKYGVRINPDLIMDLQSDFLPFDVNNSGQFELLHWNYFPLFEPNPQNIITKNVGLVSARFVNSLDTVKADGIKKTILLSTSPNSRIIGTPALISGSENKNAPEDAEFTSSHIPAAILLEGKFSSLFRNRLSPEILDTLNREGTPFIPQNVADNKIIIAGDGDIPLNSVYKGQPLPMGINPFTIGTQFEYQFANHLFVQNCIEYLVNEGGLIQAKAKDFQLRRLDPKKVDQQKTMWQLINFTGPVVLILLFGALYQVWRNKKNRIHI